MSRFLTGVGLTLALVFIFVAGSAFESPLLVLPAFCLWTPVAWFTGYAFASAGGKLQNPIQLQGKKPVAREFN